MVVDAPSALPFKRRRLTNIDPMEAEAAKVIILTKHLLSILLVFVICNVLLSFFIHSLDQLCVFDSGSIRVLSKGGLSVL